MRGETLSRRGFMKGAAAAAAGSMGLAGCTEDERDYTPVDARDIAKNGLVEYWQEDISTDLYLVQHDERTVYTEETYHDTDGLNEIDATVYDAYPTRDAAHEGEDGFTVLDRHNNPAGLPDREDDPSLPLDEEETPEQDVWEQQIYVEGRVERFFDDADGTGTPTYFLDVHEGYR